MINNRCHYDNDDTINYDDNHLPFVPANAHWPGKGEPQRLPPGSGRMEKRRKTIVAKMYCIMASLSCASILHPLPGYQRGSVQIREH